MADPRSTQAAPPDDGHLGSHTSPEDVMSVPEADQRAAPPYLHQDIPAQRSSAGLGIVAWMVIVLFFTIALVAAFYQWLP